MKYIPRMITSSAQMDYYQWRVPPSMQTPINMRGSSSTAKLPMECRVNTSLPFVKEFALLRVAVPYF